MEASIENEREGSVHVRPPPLHDEALTYSFFPPATTSSMALLQNYIYTFVATAPSNNGNAAGAAGGFLLNVTRSGSQVNVTTGVVNAAISNAVFSDTQLAVYQVDKVVLPLRIFGPAASWRPPPPPHLLRRPRGDSPTFPGGDAGEASTATGVGSMASSAFATAMLLSLFLLETTNCAGVLLLHLLDLWLFALTSVVLCSIFHHLFLCCFHLARAARS